LILSEKLVKMKKMARCYFSLTLLKSISATGEKEIKVANFFMKDRKQNVSGDTHVFRHECVETKTETKT